MEEQRRVLNYNSAPGSWSIGTMYLTYWHYVSDLLALCIWLIGTMYLTYWHGYLTYWHYVSHLLAPCISLIGTMYLTYWHYVSHLLARVSHLLALCISLIGTMYLTYWHYVSHLLGHLVFRGYMVSIWNRYWKMDCNSVMLIIFWLCPPVQVLAYSVACVAVSAFSGGLIDADKAEEVMTTLRTLTEESQQVDTAHY